MHILKNGHASIYRHRHVTFRWSSLGCVHLVIYFKDNATASVARSPTFPHHQERGGCARITSEGAPLSYMCHHIQVKQRNTLWNWSIRHWLRALVNLAAELSSSPSTYIVLLTAYYSSSGASNILFLHLLAPEKWCMDIHIDKTFTYIS